MGHEMSAQGVWDDIEFELAQGLPSRDELGQSIRAVQRHQDTLRAAVFGKGGRTGDQREIIARQFQINEMLLTLLQETATALRKVQLDIERASRTPPIVSSAGQTVAVPAVSPGEGRTIEETLRNIADFSPRSPEEAPRPLSDLEQGMRTDALELQMPRHARATTPLVGSLILRVKQAFHRLVLFHVRSLSEKQGGINRSYGEWIRYQVGLSERQGEELRGLRRRLAALEARAGTKDNPS